MAFAAEDYVVEPLLLVGFVPNLKAFPAVPCICVCFNAAFLLREFGNVRVVLAMYDKAFISYLVPIPFRSV